MKEGIIEKIKRLFNLKIAQLSTDLKFSGLYLQ